MMKVLKHKKNTLKRLRQIANRKTIKPEKVKESGLHIQRSYLPVWNPAEYHALRTTERSVS